MHVSTCCWMLEEPVCTAVAPSGTEPEKLAFGTDGAMLAAVANGEAACAGAAADAPPTAVSVVVDASRVTSASMDEGSVASSALTGTDTPLPSGSSSTSMGPVGTMQGTA